MATHKIYKALGNNTQILGCDRELFMLNILIAAALIFSSGSLLVTILSSALALVIIALLYAMGQRDALLRHVYIRQLHYRQHYLAQAALHSRSYKRYGK